MRVAVLTDVHANADALEAVAAAAVAAEVEQLWSLGDMVGTGPDAARVVGFVRRFCRVALVGNHDLMVTGSVARFGEPGSAARRALDVAAEQLEASGDLEWMRSRRPAARRGEVGCWHASPRDPVREYVGAANAGACLAGQRTPLGLIGHTHEPAAWQAQAGGMARRVRVRLGEALDVSEGRWLLNPGAAGAPFPALGDAWRAMDDHARAGAWWLELDTGSRTATWRRAPFEAGGLRERARALGLLGA